MKRAAYMKILLMIIFISVTVLINSCRKADSIDENKGQTETFTAIEQEDYSLDDIIEHINQTTEHPDEYDYHDLYNDIIGDAPGDIFYLIKHEVVKYKSVDDYGNEIELSGLFIYPYRLIGDKVKAPLISVNHGTELLKKYAPSQWVKGWSPSHWGNFAEVIIADLMAVRYGWAIVMPDYQGMGYDVNENHPYCIREKLATATADMLEVGINTIKDNNHKYVTWDGNAFVFGYSEGGYVTMAVTRELEKRKVKLTGSVCMDGPYDLSGTMLDVMLADTTFPVPYFLPLMLVGYHTIYPDIYDYDIMLKEPYRTNIPIYTTGFYPTSTVDSIMPQSHILKEIFTDAFIDTLQTKSSAAFKTLVNNDTYPDWKPETKMLLWHVKNDDCVLFGNFTAAKDAFQKAGASSITYVEWPPVINWAGTVHVSAAPIAFYEGTKWVHEQLSSKK